MTTITSNIINEMFKTLGLSMWDNRTEDFSILWIMMAKGSKYLGGKNIKSVSLLGYKGKLRWKQIPDGLVVTYPKGVKLKTSAVIKVS